MSRAASAATSCDTSPQDGKVTVTFAPSGNVQSVSLVKGFGDAAVNACVLRAFGRARIPEFSGEPVQVRKSVAW
jgi:outer membrane biosynthesis protein TonB